MQTAPTGFLCAAGLGLVANVFLSACGQGTPAQAAVLSAGAGNQADANACKAPDHGRVTCAIVCGCRKRELRKNGSMFRTIVTQGASQSIHLEVGTNTTSGLHARTVARRNG